jgi:hypothetical protein
LFKKIYLVLGGEGYFKHPSKLFYMKGIGVGQTTIFFHFESVDEHHLLKQFEATQN